MSEHSHSINTLEKLANFLSDTHVIERQGVVVHRHPRRIAVTYTSISCFASLLAIKWPIITTVLVIAILASAFLERKKMTAWVSGLSQRSCGENLIIWKDCRQFNSKPDTAPSYLIAIPWNIQTRPTRTWLTGITVIAPLMALIPLMVGTAEVQITIPLLLFTLSGLMYKPLAKALPELHPFVLHTIQRIEGLLTNESYAILLFDGGTDAKGLQTFLLNYEMILNPKIAPLFILEPKNEPTTITCFPKDLISVDGTTTIDHGSWGMYAKAKGWSVGHIRGDFDTEILSPSLKQWKNNAVVETSPEVESE